MSSDCRRVGTDLWSTSFVVPYSGIHQERLWSLKHSSEKCSLLYLIWNQDTMPPWDDFDHPEWFVMCVHFRRKSIQAQECSPGPEQVRPSFRTHLIRRKAQIWYVKLWTCSGDFKIQPQFDLTLTGWTRPERDIGAWFTNGSFPSNNGHSEYRVNCARTVLHENLMVEFPFAFIHKKFHSFTLSL